MMGFYPACFEKEYRSAMLHGIVPEWKKSALGYRLRYSSCQIQMVFSSTVVLWALGPPFSSLPSGPLCGLLTETVRLTHPEAEMQNKRMMQ